MSVSQSGTRTIVEPAGRLALALALCGSVTVGCGDSGVGRSAPAETTATLDRASLPEAPRFVPRAATFASFSAGETVAPLEYPFDGRHAGTGEATAASTDEASGIHRLPPIENPAAAADATTTPFEPRDTATENAGIVEFPTATDDVPSGLAVKVPTPVGRTRNGDSPPPMILITGPDGMPLDQRVDTQSPDGHSGPARVEAPPVDAVPSEPAFVERQLPPETAGVAAEERAPERIDNSRYSREHWNSRAAPEPSPRYVAEEPQQRDTNSAMSRLPEMESEPPSLTVERESVENDQLPEEEPSTSKRYQSAAVPGEAAPGADVPTAEDLVDASMAGPPAESPPRRVEGLLLHTTQARHHVQQGFGAANRGMLYTARKEFLQALRIVAEAKDAHHGNRIHMNALAAGLTAIEEAETIRRVSSAVAQTDLSMWIATHKTPVLKHQDVSTMLPLAIIDSYHEYAQRQLGAAAAGDPSGSMALYGLARIYEYLGSENGADRVARSRQSVALHEAALLAHPENHLAAHELGVVLTKLGRFERAVAMLTRSVQLSPAATAYRNLAVASRQFGRHQQAALAERYAAQMAEHEQAAGATSRRVTWLDPTAFSRTTERTAAARAATPRAGRDAPAPQRESAPEEQESDKASGWWKLPMWR